MVRISISEAAFSAVASTLSLGSVGYESELDARGERLVWLETAVVGRLMAMRQPGESYSDVILRLIGLEASMKARRDRPARIDAFIPHRRPIRSLWTLAHRQRQRPRRVALAPSAATTAATAAREAFARRPDLITGEPKPEIGQAYETPAADLQRGQFAPRQYSVNCSAAEPEPLGQMIDPDQRRLDVSLHFSSDPNYLLILPSVVFQDCIMNTAFAPESAMLSYGLFPSFSRDAKDLPELSPFFLS